MSSESDNSNNNEDFQFEAGTSTDDSEYNQTRPSLFTQFATKCSTTIRKQRNLSINKTKKIKCFYLETQSIYKYVNNILKNFIINLSM